MIGKCNVSRLCATDWPVSSVMKVTPSQKLKLSFVKSSIEESSATKIMAPSKSHRLSGYAIGSTSFIVVLFVSHTKDITGHSAVLLKQPHAHLGDTQL